MSFIISPSYSQSVASITGFYTSAEHLPLYQIRLPRAPEGTLIEFAAAGETHEFPIPIPRLAGLDDIELDRASFELSTAARSETASASGGVNGGQITIRLPAAEGATVRLLRIEIDRLRIDARSDANFTVTPHAGPAVLYAWNAGESKTDVRPGQTDPLAKQIHLLVRPFLNGRAGPPMAAAPAFAMPGAGGGMYGPALGSAKLTLSNDASGNIRAVLELDPPVQADTVSLLIGHADKSSPGDGLPNDVAGVSWSSQNVQGVFDVRPASVNVTAKADAAGTEQPVVAEFPSDPGNVPTTVDFAGVARSLLKKAYPSSSGDDMGLKLLFTVTSPGTLRVNPVAAAARYVRRPLAHGPESLNMLGAPETITLAVSDQYKPAAISFTVDGVYGPGRLTLDSDTAAPDARHGMRVAGAVRIARRITLTAAEANLPLMRLGLYGRASEETELLLTLHRGDVMSIGAAVGEPVSLEVAPSDKPSWNRREYAAPGLLPPHPGALWLVVRATKGSFWWHGVPDGNEFTQRSPDDGATFSLVAGRPGLHVSVRETNPAPDVPSPAFPVTLSSPDGLLNPDIVNVAGMEASLPPEFRRFWIAEGSGHIAFLQTVPSRGGLLPLTFWCQRDLALKVSDAVLTYDPQNH